MRIPIRYTPTSITTPSGHVVNAIAYHRGDDTAFASATVAVVREIGGTDVITIDPATFDPARYETATSAETVARMAEMTAAAASPTA